MIDRIFPRQFDSRFEGPRSALVILSLLTAIKLAMGLNSLFNTASVAAGADAIPLDRYGDAAATVLMFFAFWAIGQLVLASLAAVALVRYRAMVPFVFVLTFGEQLARRIVTANHDIVRTSGSSAGWWVNTGLLALLAIGLALSLIRVERDPKS